MIRSLALGAVAASVAGAPLWAVPLCLTERDTATATVVEMLNTDYGTDETTRYAETGAAAVSALQARSDICRAAALETSGRQETCHREAVRTVAAQAITELQSATGTGADMMLRAMLQAGALCLEDLLAQPLEAGPDEAVQADMTRALGQAVGAEIAVVLGRPNPGALSEAAERAIAERISTDPTQPKTRAGPYLCAGERLGLPDRGAGCDDHKLATLDAPDKLSEAINLAENDLIDAEVSSMSARLANLPKTHANPVPFCDGFEAVGADFRGANGKLWSEIVRDEICTSLADAGLVAFPEPQATFNGWDKVTRAMLDGNPATRDRIEPLSRSKAAELVAMLQHWSGKRAEAGSAPDLKGAFCEAMSGLDAIWDLDGPLANLPPDLRLEAEALRATYRSVKQECPQ